MHQPSDDHRLRVGSLFSGYGGLDLAVEEVFNARTVWFSEINEPVARVFAHHWPDAPNLGDITTIDWTDAEPVDILCGGFPCLNVKLGCSASVAGSKGVDGFDVTRWVAEVLFCPLLDAGKPGTGDDIVDEVVGLNEGASHRDGAVGEDRPVRARATVGKPDAARVDDEASVDQTSEGHVRVSADDRADVVGQVAEHVDPAFEPTVDQNDLLIVAGRGVAEPHWPEAVDRDRDLFGHRSQQLLMVRPELRRTPDRQRVVCEPDIDAMGDLEQLSIRVPAHQNHSVSQGGQTVEHFDRLRTPGVIAGDDDQLRIRDRGLDEDTLQRREHTVDVGEHRHRRDHASTIPRKTRQAAIVAAFSAASEVTCPAGAPPRSNVNTRRAR